MKFLDKVFFLIYKLKSPQIAVCVVLVLTGLVYAGMSQYTKHAIQGNWKCMAGDGRIAGIYEFSDHDYYLVTYSRNSQYYGNYKTNWKTIKTSIIGSPIGEISADENHPIEGQIDFIEKGNDSLVLKLWPTNHPMGVGVFCERI
jgi:uncharacterized protein YjeT (DUF2065 family)